MIRITLDRDAASERIASVGFFARADGIVTDDATLSVGAANSSAWIFTFLIDTGQVGRAIAVADTFGPAVGHRADHAVLTTALGLVTNHLTFGIGTWTKIR